MKNDSLAWFRELSKEDQREHILSVCALCRDGAQVTLARKIEIYLDVSQEDQKARLLNYRL